MSVDTECGIMVGLPYKEFSDICTDTDEKLTSGELEISSIYYDSYHDRRNIVGRWIVYAHKPEELDVINLLLKINKARSDLETEFPQLISKLKVYLTTNIT